MNPAELQATLRAAYSQADQHMQAAIYVLVNAVPRRVKTTDTEWTYVGYWLTQRDFTAHVLLNKDTIMWDRVLKFTSGPRSDGEKAVLRLACSLAGYCGGTGYDWSIDGMLIRLDDVNREVVKDAWDMLWFNTD